MKKRLIALSLVLAMAATATACGGSKSDSAAADTSAASDSADASADSADASTEGGVTGDYRELSLFAGSIPENTPTGGALAAMADYINENSNGTLNAIAYYDTALGDATSRDCSREL